MIESSSKQMSENLHKLVSDLIVDSKGLADGGLLHWSVDSTLSAFAPELILCATIVIMLLVRLCNFDRRMHVSSFCALVGSLAAFILAAFGPTLGTAPPEGRMEIFTGMLVYDTFGVFIRSVLLCFAFLFVILTRLTGIPDREDGPDIYTLTLGATLGMCLMASANHLLMVFMSVEMASVPSYALAGMMKGRRQGSEAALKYSIYGAGAAGVMLYGISLIAGLVNSAHLPTMATLLADKFQQGGIQGGEAMVLALGGLMIMVGLAFKLSAVPFHFWCPDVFEGATAEVNAFLSVASKAAALALLVRVVIGFGTVPSEGYKPGEFASVSESQKASDGSMYVSLTESDHEHDSHATSDEALLPVRSFMGKVVALFAIITCTFGNLAAYGQTNIKRLMAYSTIAHAGYMMMPIPVVMVLAQSNPEAGQAAIAGLCIYLGIYLFMNLGAFAIIAFMRNAMHSEEIADYAGLIRRCPLTVICLSAILFSLVGLPPLAGFIGKFAIFASLADGYRLSGEFYLLVLLLVGGVNTAISLFYYLRVVKVMTLEDAPEDSPSSGVSDFSTPWVFSLLMGAAMFVLFVKWDLLADQAIFAARHLL